MDPITLAILSAIAAGVTAGATKVSEQAIIDAYKELKELLKHKFGAQSEVIKAVEGVETRPDSDNRKGTLKEEMKTAKADQDAELLVAAQTLQALVNKSQGKPADSIVINQRAGDNSLQIGQVSGTVNIER